MKLTKQKHFEKRYAWKGEYVKELVNIKSRKAPGLLHFVYLLRTSEDNEAANSCLPIVDQERDSVSTYSRVEVQSIVFISNNMSLTEVQAFHA
jgi:hypothetical protein